MNLDGSNVYTSIPARGIVFSFAMHMDTVKKKVWVFTDTILYVHADAGIADLPDDPGAFSAVSHPISIDMTWPVVDGVASYEVKYSIGPKNAAGKTTSVSSTTGLEHSIRNLIPDTEYSVYLYDTEEGLLLFSGTYKTLLNVAANHSKSAYATDKGFDLSKLDARSFRNLDGVMNELFATGDSISLNVSSMPMQAKFVKRGGSTSVERGGVLAIPFSATSGSGQSVTLTLSDDTSVVVTYDESTEQITVGGQAYETGDSFSLGGQKVTIVTL